MAVGAPGSTTEKLQWRLSFSRAEVVVSSHLANEQKCAVIAFKLCKSALGQEGKGIKSYFAKTAMLWLCEQTPTEDWTSVTQGVLKLLDFLDEAVSKANLPCFFWSRINLLRFTSQEDRNAMEETLRTIRTHLMGLLAHEVSVLHPKVQKMLTHSIGRLSERQLRVCLTRWQIVVGCVKDSVRMHMTMTTTDTLSRVLPVLTRSYTPGDVISLFYRMRYRCIVQLRLYQALTVAPADVASQVRLSSSSGGGFEWDAAPLLGLLTEDDLKEVLGNPDAVRDWLRRHHQLPETERPTGTLPTDLRSPRDLYDLLINTPLLIWVLKESVPNMWSAYQRVVTERPMGVARYAAPVVEAQRESPMCLARSVKFAEVFHTKLGMDGQTAVPMAFRIGGEMQQLYDNPQTLAELRRLCHILQDPWQLSHFVLGGPS